VRCPQITTTSSVQGLADDGERELLASRLLHEFVAEIAVRCAVEDQKSPQDIVHLLHPVAPVRVLLSIVNMQIVSRNTQPRGEPRAAGLIQLAHAPYCREWQRESRSAGRFRSMRGSSARSSELGSLLADLRVAKGLSLRQVEEATERSVSNAYLSQLEKGKIRQPSPNVLNSLALVYSVPYEVLMEKAGYPLAGEREGGRRQRRLRAFSFDDLTAEEEEELLKYLAFLRSRKPLP
jgi:HTH-type transcriptional regulator, competence development regulator